MVAVGVPVAVLEILGRLALDYQVAGGVLIEAADDIQQRRLAAAGVAKDRDEFALAELDAHTFKCDDLAVACRVLLDDILSFSIYSTSYEKFTVLDKAVVICYTCNGYKCNISL